MAYKLYYFDARGLCEPLRWIFEIGGVNFEEERFPVTLPQPMIPPEIKAKTNWGQVPMVEFEGKMLCQSLAMQRYFARKFDLIGSTEFEAALCDEYVDSALELMKEWLMVFKEQDASKKKELQQETLTKVEPRWLKKYNEILEKNGNKHLVGNQLTWADIWLAHVLQNIEIAGGIDITKNYPKLKAFRDSVLGYPPIQAWIEKRPKTNF